MCKNTAAGSLYCLWVTRFGLAARRQDDKQEDLGSIRFGSHLFKKMCFIYQPLWFVLHVVCATAHRPTILFLYQVLPRLLIPGIAEIFVCLFFLYQVLPRFFLYQVLPRFFVPGVAEIFCTRHCRDIFAPYISLRPRTLSVRPT